MNQKIKDITIIALFACILFVQEQILSFIQSQLNTFASNGNYDLVFDGEIGFYDEDWIKEQLIALVEQNLLLQEPSFLSRVRKILKLLHTIQKEHCTTHVHIVVKNHLFPMPK
mgnify:CR=1 FL=1